MMHVGHILLQTENIIFTKLRFLVYDLKRYFMIERKFIQKLARLNCYCNGIAVHCLSTVQYCCAIVLVFSNFEVRTQISYI